MSDQPAILALIDDSPHASGVCDCAAWLSSTTGAEVNLLHVVDIQALTASRLAMVGGLAVGHGPGLVMEAARLSRGSMGPALARGADLLETAKEDMLSKGAAGVKPKLVRGSLARAVQAAQSHCGIVVFGKRGEGESSSRPRLGGTAKRLWRTMGLPSLLTAPTFKPPRKWMLAFAPSERLERGLAALSGGRLVPRLPVDVVHVGSSPVALNETMATTVRLVDAGFDATCRVREGSVKDALLGHAEDENIELLALAGPRQSPLYPVLGGRLGENLIKRSQLPVLLLR